MKKLVRTLVAVALLAAVCGGALLASAWWWLDRPLSVQPTPAVLEISLGMSPRHVAAACAAAGVDAPAWLLYRWFRVSGGARHIRAGNYEIASGTTPRQLLKKLVDGDESLARVRLGEGWTFRQIRHELAQADGLKSDTAQLSEQQVMALLGAAGVSAEGRFFPDTYAFAKGTPDLAVLTRAYTAMNRHLSAAWEQRDPRLPLANMQEVLTLASIVEKETGRPEDRAQIAGVFINRLRQGMPLQTDPTVIYGLGEQFDGNLRKRDLLNDGPYNTYTRKGLPPTPIALPGLAAIQAAVRPAPTNALYFVARGDGSSAFSDSLAEHNRAVNRYQRQSAAQP